MGRVFLIVLDSFGVGEMPDAADYGDVGSNTLYAVTTDKEFYTPNMKRLGLFQMDGVNMDPNRKWIFEKEEVIGSYARMTERSKGKDTTIGHWEIAGIVSDKPLPTFPNGFPKELLHKLEEKTGRKTICNATYSGTEVIRDYGREHLETGALIVYTSADSVMQIAAHEKEVPLVLLYQYCEMARELCKDEYAVGRVIARPFDGEDPDFTRTAGRHDYSIEPPKDTMLTLLQAHQKDVVAIGKIHDIFASKGIGEMTRTLDNAEGIEQTLAWMKKDFNGLCFVNLVDFDMKYGHRNNVPGYAGALNYFDKKLPELMQGLRKEDLLMITADHGCDPSTPSTDHSREYVPLMIYGEKVKKGANLGTKETFADIAATILDYFDVKEMVDGKSFLQDCMEEER